MLCGGENIFWVLFYLLKTISGHCFSGLYFRWVVNNTFCKSYLNIIIFWNLCNSDIVS